jgi:hypothetical protein
VLNINPLFLEQLRGDLTRHMRQAVERGAAYSRDVCPVDTSSLQESIRVSPAELRGKVIEIDLLAGGEDYSGQLMASTGKTGNIVDYAAEQEAATAFLSSASSPIISSLLGA